MTKALKTLHLLGLAVFLGSIPGHILLGQMAAGAGDLDKAALLLAAKHTSTLALTLPGLALSVVTGALPLARRRELLRSGWMRAKLGLVTLLVANGVLLLSPVGAEMAHLGEAAAASGALPPQLASLAAREGMLGAANLLMILAIVSLAVARPRRRAAVAA